eukprot:TRINITY_DN2015_c0_g2_i1.p1 TRINITY_DN2015_c0_g2~~TRINITY_DN2015_c0_g2_i1.p1  ORF type:complete len:857 (+),score=250.73 TRINITY_DN2015_c0_g2_i1:80-2572(+)
MGEGDGYERVPGSDKGQKRDGGEEGKEGETSGRSFLSDLVPRFIEALSTMSVHSRSALSCCIVLFATTAISAALTTQAAHNLSDVDPTPADYLPQVERVVGAVSREHLQSQSFAVAGGAAVCQCSSCAGCSDCPACRDLRASWSQTDEAVDRLGYYHYAEQVEGFPASPVVKYLQPLYEALMLDLISCVRKLVYEGYSEVILEAADATYDDVEEHATVLGGRRAAARMSNFGRQNLGMLGILQLIESLGDGVFSHVALSAARDAAARRSASDSAAAAYKQFLDAEVLYRSTLPLSALERLDYLFKSKRFKDVRSEIMAPLKRPQGNQSGWQADATLSEPAACVTEEGRSVERGPQILSSGYFDISGIAFGSAPRRVAQAQQEAPSMPPTASPEFTSLASALRHRCFAESAEMGAEIKQVHRIAKDRMLGPGKYVQRITVLAVLLLTCFIGTLMHGLNVVAYQRAETQVLVAEREVARLEESVQRMHGCVAHAAMLDLATFDLKVKGVPPPELSLYSVVPKIRCLQDFLPEAILTERMRAINPTLNPSAAADRPLTELGFTYMEDVTVLVYSVSDLNAQAPAAGDPVKQKSLEMTATKFFTFVEQQIAGNGGTVMGLVADCLTIAWNLCNEHAAKHPQQKAQEAAGDTVFAANHHLSRELPTATPCAAIVTGPIIAGNVGMKQLKTFVVLGPAQPLARHMSHLAALYHVRCIIDGPTEDVVSKADYQVRPIDFVTMEMGDQGEGRLTLYELFGARSTVVAREGDSKLQSWLKCFQHLADGEPKEAYAEMKRYEAKSGHITPLTTRFAELCAAYPNVPGKDIFDFVEYQERR